MGILALPPSKEARAFVFPQLCPPCLNAENNRFKRARWTWDITGLSVLVSLAWKVVMFSIKKHKKHMFESVISFLLDERLAELWMVILTEWSNSSNKHRTIFLIELIKIFTVNFDYCSIRIGNGTPIVRSSSIEFDDSIKKIGLIVFSWHCLALVLKRFN